MSTNDLIFGAILVLAVPLTIVIVSVFGIGYEKDIKLGNKIEIENKIYQCQEIK